MNDARVPAAPITGAYGAVVKMAMRKMVGSVPDSLGVMWNNPAVFKGMLGFNRTAEKWHELDPNLVSLAHMAAAASVGCSFCLDLNYFLAHNRGLDEQKAREVPRWRSSEVYTPLERLVMDYADAMSQTPVTVTDALSNELSATLGASALLELTARIALMNTSARMNIALGIHSAEFADACGLEPLAAPPTADVGSTA